MIWFSLGRRAEYLNLVFWIQSILDTDKDRENGDGRLNVNSTNIKQGYKIQGIQLFVDKWFLNYLVYLLLVCKLCITDCKKDSLNLIDLIDLISFRSIMTPNDWVHYFNINDYYYCSIFSILEKESTLVFSLGNPKNRGTWWATVHGVAKSQTWLSHQTTTTILSRCW